MPPPMGSPNWTRGGGRGPSFPLPLPLFPSPFLLPSWTRKGESYSHLEEDSPLLGAPQGPAGLPLAPLYTGAGGTLGHTS